LVREEGGYLAGSVGQVIGASDGHRIAFLYLVLEVLILLAVLAAYLNPSLRQEKLELPNFFSAKDTLVPED
jgi:predicted MFS family arabinose efflux permease